MVDTTQWTGAIPEYDPDYWSLHGDVEEFLNHEAMAWLDWMVRTRYAQLLGAIIGPHKQSIRVTLYWGVGLDQIFAQTPPPIPERVDTVLDRLVDRAGQGAEAYTYREPTPERRMDYRHTSVLANPNFRYQIEFFVNRPKPPAYSRDAQWLARRIQMEVRKLGFEHKWALAGLDSFNYWLKIDGKDIYIPRPRDLDAEPLARRIKVRSKNGQQTESAQRVDSDLCGNERVASKRRRIVIRRRNS